MNARIRPLDGKYYGTIVDIDLDDGHMWKLNNDLRVWFFHGPPSARQLEAYEMTMADEGSEKWNDLFSDNHSETALSYRVAEAIIKALESVEGCKH